MQVARAEVPADSIRLAAGEVFHSRVYTSSLHQSVWDWVVAQVGRLFDMLVMNGGFNPAARTAFYIGLVALLGFVLIRMRFVRNNGRSVRRGPSTPSWPAEDPWLRAHAEAAAGRYLEAAHALYLATLLSLSNQERLRVHPAKTVGDYLRDLRRNSSPAYSDFRAFANFYERVVWGDRSCDRECFERLARTADPIMHGRA